MPPKIALSQLQNKIISYTAPGSHHIFMFVGLQTYDSDMTSHIIVSRLFGDKQSLQFPHNDMTSHIIVLCLFRDEQTSKSLETFRLLTLTTSEHMRASNLPRLHFDFQI